MVGSSVELARELESDGHADEHAQAGFLGDECPDLSLAVGGIFGRRRLAHRLVVPGAEPSTLVERAREQALERRRRSEHDLLRLPHAAEITDRGQGGLELLIGVGTVRQPAWDHRWVAVALTSLSHGAGCGCKLPAAAIAPLLERLGGPVADPNVLVGFQTSDDAGVYRVRDDLAIVQTVDFFTPIVDDPFDFGRIAAANALSDIYAMGATPLSALNLVAFSLQDLGEDLLVEILRGGAAIAAEAGVAILGGHSIEDAEPKYGMAVTGAVHPDEVITNAGGRVGDVLVLTKPLGAGAVSTAIKRGLPAPLEAAVAVMTTLNRDASAAARAAAEIGRAHV